LVLVMDWTGRLGGHRGFVDALLGGSLGAETTFRSD
jgi:hypothetical protein